MVFIQRQSPDVGWFRGVPAARYPCACCPASRITDTEQHDRARGRHDLPPTGDRSDSFAKGKPPLACPAKPSPIQGLFMLETSPVEGLCHAAPIISGNSELHAYATGSDEFRLLVTCQDG